MKCLAIGLLIAVGIMDLMLFIACVELEHKKDERERRRHGKMD